jgi:hypothetical protein
MIKVTCIQIYARGEAAAAKMTMERRRRRTADDVFVSLS